MVSLSNVLLTLVLPAALVAEECALEMAIQQMTMIRVATAAIAVDLEEDIPVD